MFYVIMKFKEGIGEPLRDSSGHILQFTNKELAEIERIYLQPEYDDLLKVIGIK